MLINVDDPTWGNLESSKMWQFFSMVQMTTFKKKTKSLPKLSSYILRSHAIFCINTCEITLFCCRNAALLEAPVNLDTARKGRHEMCSLFDRIKYWGGGHR